MATTAPSAAANRDRTLYGTGLGHCGQRHALGLTRQQLQKDQSAVEDGDPVPAARVERCLRKLPHVLIKEPAFDIADPDLKQLKLGR